MFSPIGIKLIAGSRVLGLRNFLGNNSRGSLLFCALTWRTRKRHAQNHTEGKKLRSKFLPSARTWRVLDLQRAITAHTGVQALQFCLLRAFGAGPLISARTTRGLKFRPQSHDFRSVSHFCFKSGRGLGPTIL